jgi:hypothetical protein
MYGDIMSKLSLFMLKSTKEKKYVHFNKINYYENILSFVILKIFLCLLISLISFDYLFYLN